MTNAHQLDIGAHLVGMGMLDAATITAGAGNDNTELNGLSIDRTLIPKSVNGGLGLSMQVAVYFKAVLAAAETLSFAGNLQDDTATGFNAAAADYPFTRARLLLSTGVLTELTLNAAGGVDAVVVAKGPGGGGTVRGVILLDVDLKHARQFVRLQRTMNLSASGTDTVLDYAYGIIGGLTGTPAAVPA